MGILELGTGDFTDFAFFGTEVPFVYLELFFFFNVNFSTASGSLITVCEWLWGGVWRGSLAEGWHWVERFLQSDNILAKHKQGPNFLPNAPSVLLRGCMVFDHPVGSEGSFLRVTYCPTYFRSEAGSVMP